MVKITTLIPDGITQDDVLKLMWAIHKLAPKGASVILENKPGTRQGPVGEEQRHYQPAALPGLTSIPDRRTKGRK